MISPNLICIQKNKNKKHYLTWRKESHDSHLSTKSRKKKKKIRTSILEKEKETLPPNPKPVVDPPACRNRSRKLGRLLPRALGPFSLVPGFQPCFSALRHCPLEFFLRFR